MQAAAFMNQFETVDYFLFYFPGRQIGMQSTTRIFDHNAIAHMGNYGETAKDFEVNCIGYITDS